MRKMKIDAADKALIKAYFNWSRKKGFNSTYPSEYDCSSLIENMNSDHRDLVENYLDELRLAECQK